MTGTAVALRPGLPFAAPGCLASLQGYGERLRRERPWLASLADATLPALPVALVGAAAVGSGATPDEALAVVCSVWQRRADHDELSQQTADRFSQLAGRFVAYCAARGAATLADAEAVVPDWVHVRGRDRSGAVAEPAAATKHLRRSTLRALWRECRALGLSDADPTLDLVLPARGTGTARPLSDDEVALCRMVAAATTWDTRGPAVLALSLASAGTAELGQVRVADVDLRAATVALPGTRRSAGRTARLDRWAVTALAARVAEIRTLTGDGEAAAVAPLVYAGEGAPAARQAAACVAVSEVLHRAGLGQEPDVRPASVAAVPARVAWETSGRIEDAAVVLGLSSLDAAARAVGHDWQRDVVPVVGPTRWGQ